MDFAQQLGLGARDFDTEERNAPADLKVQSR
jgi:hypothetical protein